MNKLAEKLGRSSRIPFKHIHQHNSKVEGAGFHYRSHRVAFMQKVFVLKRKERVCGAVVYVHPMSAAPCRNGVLKIENIKELNEKLARIARVVVHRNTAP